MLKEFLKFLLWVIALLAIVAAVLRAFFVDIVVISDDRMAPTLIAGEQAFMWRGSEPKYGRIVVCQNPSVAGQLVMGRVIASTGMEVKVERDMLNINNHRPDLDWTGMVRWDDPAVGRPLNIKWGIESLTGVDHLFMVREDFHPTLRTTRVGGGKLYLLSDYRSMVGYDSRTFGVVDASTCIGHIFMRYTPAEGRVGEAPFDHGYLDILD